MATTPVEAAVQRALEGRRLLDHPFYRRWQAGELQPDELAEYAAQYRHFEQALVPVLTAAVAALPEGHARDLVAANLADELGTPEPHVALFERFAAGAGASADADPTPATAALVELYVSALDGGAATVLAVIGAYEVQAGEIAATKAAGLRRHYNHDDESAAFWDVHAAIEAGHAAWTLDALADLGAAPATIESAARRSADAWWNFLSERDASRETTPASC